MRKADRMAPKENPYPESPSEDEIRTLLEQARSGDSPALARLLSLYQPLLSATVSRYARDLPGSEDRKDMRQEIEIAFVKAVNTFRPEERKVTFGLYAKIVTRNAAVTYLRHAGAKKRAEKGTVPKTDAKPYAIAKPISPEWARQIRRRLSAFEKQVLDLYKDGLKPAQIAAELKTGPKSVWNALSRIRRKARQLGEKEKDDTDSLS